MPKTDPLIHRYKPTSTSKGLLARLVAKIAITDDLDACWPWTGSTIRGYGQIRVGNGPKLAHRVVYEIEHDVNLKKGQVVCHRCDNPPCCNPNHFFIGTQADNLADMTAKGRRSFGFAVGEKQGLSKLTEDDVREIRRAKAAGETLRSLAKRFSVAPGNIHMIVHRQTWKHVS